MTTATLTPLLLALVIGLILGALAAATFYLPRIKTSTANHAALAARLRAAEDTALLAKTKLEAITDNTTAQDNLAAATVERVLPAIIAVAEQKLNADRQVNTGFIAAETQKIAKGLETLSNSIQNVTRAQIEDRTFMRTTLESLTATNGVLMEAIARTHTEAQRLSAALTSTSVRGTWGEIELRRIIELAGMTEHVSFETQASGYGRDGRGIPDVVVHLPTGKTIPIDSKVPFDAYRAAVEITDPDLRQEKMSEAAAAVIAHINELRKRGYHDSRDCAGFTLMFLPLESMLLGVFGVAPDLLERAARHNIYIASPMTMLMYLRAFADGWTLHKQRRNEQEILRDVAVLIERLHTFTGHLTATGRSISGAVDGYNRAIGSLEQSVSPAAKRIIGLIGGKDAEAAPQPVATAVRVLDESRLALGPGSLFDAVDPS